MTAERGRWIALWKVTTVKRLDSGESIREWESTAAVRGRNCNGRARFQFFGGLKW